MIEQSEISKITQKQTQKLLDENLVDDQTHPASDIGHSYGYIQANDEKIEANLKYTQSNIKDIINKYQYILKIDNNLCQKLDSLEEFTKFKNDDMVDKQTINEKFDDLILTIEQLTQEEQRMTEESPSNSKKLPDDTLNFNNLKKEILSLKESILQTY